MPFIIVGVIISIVLIYGIMLFLKDKQTSTIDKLDEQKIAIFDIPVDSVVLKLKTMHLSGKTKKLYESWAVQWDELNRDVLPEVEADIELAEQYSNQLRLLKAKKHIEDIKNKLNSAEKKAFQIDEALQRIIESENSNHEEIESAQKQYEEVASFIQNHQDDYKESALTLMKKLDDISDKFKEFNELMEEADFLEAKEVLEDAKSTSAYLSKVIEVLPGLYHEVDVDMIEQLEELKSGYQTLSNEQYQFNEGDLSAQLTNIEQAIGQIKENLKHLQIEHAKELKEDTENSIDNLYQIMEVEVQAKQVVQKQLPKLKIKVEQIIENNRFLRIEIDRLLENYELTDDEDKNISEFENKLVATKEKLQAIDDKIKANELVFSNVEITLNEFNDQLLSIDEKQTELKNSLSDLKTRENDVKEQLDLFEIDLRNMKRKLEKQHLPGLSPLYMDLFLDTTKRLEELSALINRVKINMKEIDQLVSQCETDLEHLEEATNRIIDNSLMTEQLVQYANRYRSEYASIEKAITTAINLYQYQYKYTEARQTMETALDAIEAGASRRVEAMYQADKKKKI